MIGNIEPTIVVVNQVNGNVYTGHDPKAAASFIWGQNVRGIRITITGRAYFDIKLPPELVEVGAIERIIRANFDAVT